MAKQTILASNAQSDYAIVIPKDALPTVEFAAQELSHFFESISGAKLDVVNPSQDIEKAIYIGINDDVDFKEEDFRIRIEENAVFISGGTRGILYGVYTFLEDYLGCLFLTPDYTHIVKKRVVSLPLTDKSYSPSFSFRSMTASDMTSDALWCARRKLNGPMLFDHSKLGGGLAVYSMDHSYSTFISAKEYYDSHPEYFSEVDGVRLRERTQLCLSNPDVFKIVLDKMRDLMAQNPDKRIFAFAQDDHPNPCACSDCAKVDTYEGSHSGSLIRFCNKLCEALESEFPNNQIYTFAYLFTRKPPKHTKPHRNIFLHLCPIECCFERPLEDCKEDDRRCNHEFVSDLKGWCAIHSNVHIYDYPCTWHHYLTPNCNLRAMQPNIRLYSKHGVKGIHELLLTRTSNYGDLFELKAYILSNLMFDKDYDVESGILKFTQSYYGEAGRIIRKYMEYVGKIVLEKGQHQGGNISPDPAVFTPDIMDTLNDIFDEAEGVALSSETLERVQKARLPVDYYSAYFHLSDKRRDLVNTFREKIKTHNIARLEETSLPEQQLFRFMQPQYFEIFKNLKPFVSTLPDASQKGE